jgi:hypothetical protein
MTEQSERQKVNETVLEYVKAATSASDRARAVMIVLVTATVLVFTVIWNTGGWHTSGGWFDERIRLRVAALKHFDPGFNPDGESLSAEEKDLHQRAKKFLTLAHYNTASTVDKERLSEDVKHLNRIRTEEIRLVHVPFFGIVFDMNDLGIFAGVTFTVVLLWLRYSLAREYRNLKLALNEAEEKKQLKLAYELLVMQQVLTVPPMKDQPRRRIWAFVAKILYMIPLLIYAWQYKTDWDTSDVGNLLSPRNMTTLLWTNAVMLILILFLTIQCLHLSIKIDRRWEKAFKAAYPQEGQAKAGEAGRERPGATESIAS